MGNTSGLAITALVLGILALMLSFVPILNLLVAIAALIFGSVGLIAVKKSGQEGRGMAIAGIVLGSIAIVISIIFFVGMMAYFGVLSPSKMLPERTSFSAPIISEGNAEISSSENSIVIPFRNLVGSSITVPLTSDVTSTQCSNPTLTGKYNGETLTPNTQIPNGEIFTLKWICSGSKPRSGDKLEATISFDYVNTGIGMTRTHIGSVYGQYK
jgi:hypothetical protein